MIKKTPKKSKNRDSQHKKSTTKLPLFYKILLSFAIFFVVILFYFVVLVSSSPKSINFITQKIQKNLEANFDNNVKIKDSFINFTSYGSFKIAVNDLVISYQDSQAEQSDLKSNITKNLNIPKIEAEFSLWDIIFFKLNPSKIKIFSPEIIIENTTNITDISNNINISQDKNNEQIFVLLNFLSSFRKSKNPIENFEIEDAKIIFQTPKINSTLIIKNTKIATKINGETLDISLQSAIYFLNNKSESKIDSNCKLSKADGLKCDINLFNFLPNSLVGFHPLFDDFANINTNLNGSLNIAINSSTALNKVDFKLRADRGSFEFKKFFKDKIEFKNMDIEGGFDGANKLLNIAKINADLVSNIAYQTEISNPHLALGLSINLMQENQTTYDFSINLKNVLTNEILRFWPITLSHNNIRNWVGISLSNGFIKEAQGHLTIIENAQETILEKINAQVDFEDATLNYGASFPTISHLSGVANFSKKDMKIKIFKGDILDSKIIDAEVAIDDFQMPINLLSLKAKMVGKSGDGLKHLSNDEQFRAKIDKYINGTAQTEVQILIPIVDNLALKNVFIDIKSKISDIKNDILEGSIDITTKKAYNSNIVNNFIDLKDCEISNQEFQISKKKSEIAQLFFNIDLADDKVIKVKNILLTNQELALTKNKIPKNTRQSRIEGEFSFEYNPFNLVALKIKNHNFSQNNYDINYAFNKAESKLNLSFRGKYFNPSNFLKAQSSNDSVSLPSDIKINIALDNLELKNKKQFKKFKLNLACKDLICKSGSLFANISNQKNNPKIINLKIEKYLKNNDEEEGYKIEGSIADIGFVVEALGVSNLISGGSSKISILQNIIDKKLVLEGSLKTNSDITIYENEGVKKLANNNLFSQIKDKIFASEKTIFSSVAVEFALQESNLTIKSLIANNFKIGVTAKGTINLKNQETAIKGMIIPGYIINSLFGLGKIPILGSVISGVLTGGDGGGVFSMRYEYNKKAGQKEGEFTTNKISAFVPSSISGLFE